MVGGFKLAVVPVSISFCNGAPYHARLTVMLSLVHGDMHHARALGKKVYNSQVYVTSAVLKMPQSPPRTPTSPELSWR